MAGESLVQGPATEPVTLAEARADRNLTVPDKDAEIAGALVDARKFIETELSRALITQRWRATFDGGWPAAFDGCGYRTRIVLPRAPLLSVVSVQYVDTSGATQTLATADYQVARVGDSRARGFIEPAYGVSWPAVRSQIEAVSVTYDAGYGAQPGDVPGDLHRAIMLLAAHMFENREAVVIGTGGAEVPFTVERLISRYRVEL